MAKRLSRSDKWAAAAAKAVEGLSELQELQTDYQSWYDNLPENLQQSATGEKLEAITQLDIDSALETAQEAESIDLPLGFGRD